MPHTPGPWKVLTLDDGTEWVQADCGTCNARIAIVDDSAGCQPGNAHLIAAAPELLEALEASRKAINTLDEDALGMGTREDGHGGINYWPFKVELLHQIDTAIAKAKEEA